MSSAVGFIGIGIMGDGMASRLISEGIAGSDEDSPLVIWNRTNKKCEDLKKRFSEKHIIIKSSPKEVVEMCGVSYSMLSTPQASKEVFYASNGVLSGVSEGKSIVDCATLAENDMKEMNEAVNGKGGRFLEAPVSGSKVPAANGSLVFLCAGSKILFDEIDSTALKAMGKANHFFGEVGYGTRAKLVVNSLMGTIMAAFGEGLALSESVGLNGDQILEVISQGAIQSPMFSLKGPKMLTKDTNPHFPLTHAHKDMALACKMAEKVGTEFSVMQQAELLFRQAKEDETLNVANQDFSAVYEKIHSESSSEFSKKRRMK